MLSITATVKRPPDFTWHIGHTEKADPADRVPGQPPTSNQPLRKVDLIVDLKADQKVSFSVQATDEMGNPTDFDGTIVFAVDDTSLVALTDNGDGTGSVAAVGPVGLATLTVEATRTGDGQVFSGAAAINVTAGDVEGIAVEFGEPEEATPDF